MPVHKKQSRLTLKLLLCCSLISGASDALATSYTFTNLGQGVAWAINNAGQIAGAQSDANNNTRATIWNNGIATRLDTLGGSASSAIGINRYGQVVGYSEMSGGTIHATLWDHGSLRDLGTLGGTNSYASDINDQGQIVGFAYTDGRVYRHASLWQSGKVFDLDTSESSGASNATAINSSGKIVGTFLTQTMTSSIATIWSGSAPTFLRMTNSLSSNATDVNDHGDIAGNFLSRDGHSHAALWTQEGVIDLGMSGTDSAANAINNHNQIVGNVTIPNSPYSHAVLWDGTTALDLNTLLQADDRAAGWLLFDATDINDDGTIVGVALNSKTGAQHAFLLATSAVPEPSTYALFLAGFALLGYLANRRRCGSSPSPCISK